MGRLINPGWRSKKKKVWSERKKRSFRKLLRARAKGIQGQEKLSDVWFQNLWEESGMFIAEGPYRDRFNEPFTFYIPDVVNFFYRYVIEVDDPTHRKAAVQVKDRKKDKFYRESGYEVFRVKSFDYEGFKRVKAAVMEIRARKDRGAA